MHGGRCAANGERVADASIVLRGVAPVMFCAERQPSGLLRRKLGSQVAPKPSFVGRRNRKTTRLRLRPFPPLRAPTLMYPYATKRPLRRGRRQQQRLSSGALRWARRRTTPTSTSTDNDQDQYAPAARLGATPGRRVSRCTDKDRPGGNRSRPHGLFPPPSRWYSTAPAIEQAAPVCIGP